MIAAGIGCRRACSSGDVVAALSDALAAAGRVLSDVHALYAPEFKQDEGALLEVATQLGKPLVLLAREALERQAAFALTRSERVMEQVGLPSVAETAALAGGYVLAGEAARVQLLGPRAAVGGATCALARVTKEHVR
jgi:cobalamin biosynthesis protein CbiG